MIKIELNKNEIANALKIALPAVSGKTTLPILAHVLIETLDNKIRLTTTDLHVRIETYCNAVCEAGNKFSFDVKKLNNAVSRSSNDKITIEADEKNATVFKSGNFKLKSSGMSLADFPVKEDFTETNSFDINSNNLIGAINRVAYAVSIDHTNRSLHGVYFEVDNNKLINVTTNGKQCCFMSSEVKSTGEKVSFIVPKRTTEIINSLEKSVIVKSNDKKILFSDGNTTISSNLIDGNFPDYNRFILEKQQEPIIIDTNDMVKCLNVVTIIQAEYITMTIADNKILFNANNSKENVSDEMATNYNGESLSICVYPEYLFSIIKNLDSVNMELSIDNVIKPMRVDNGDYICVFVPLRDKK